MSEYDYMFKDGNLIGIPRDSSQASLEQELPPSNDEEGPWFEIRESTVVKTVQIQGNSGIYIVETDYLSGEVLRDDRPWQMTA